MNSEPTYQQLAEHFRDIKGPRTNVSAKETFRKVDQKHRRGEPSLWDVWVKAYLYDHMMPTPKLPEPDYFDLAKHFQEVKGPRSEAVAIEAFRKVDSKHRRGGVTLWHVWVKAYWYDLIQGGVRCL